MFLLLLFILISIWSICSLCSILGLVLWFCLEVELLSRYDGVHHVSFRTLILGLAFWFWLLNVLFYIILLTRLSRDHWSICAINFREVVFNKWHWFFRCYSSVTILCVIWLLNLSLSPSTICCAMRWLLVRSLVCLSIIFIFLGNSMYFFFWSPVRIIFTCISALHTLWSIRQWFWVLDRTI